MSAKFCGSATKGARVYERSRQRRRPGHSQRWPRNQQRERVLRLVREQSGPVDAAELANQMGLHVTTVRFHLDALCDAGAVTRTRIKRAGVGRPRTGYVAVRDRLDYQSLVEVLALELGDTVAERRQRAERAGKRWAERIAENESSKTVQTQGIAGSAGPTIDDRTAVVAKTFDRMGFDPELAPVTDTAGDRRERTIRLHGCPVRDLARSHREVSCGMHLGLLRGLLGTGRGAGGGATLHGELEPFVEPELCIAKVMTDD